MGVTSTYLPSGAIHEYTGHLDFRLSARSKWRVWTVIKTKDDEALMRHFMAKKLDVSYEMEVHAVGSAQRVMLEFKLKDIDLDAATARRELLRFLTTRKLPIIWKEGRHGYEINKSGTIHRKWKLNSQWSVPARDTDA